MKVKKRLSAGLVCVLMLSAMLSACGGSDSSSKAGGDSTAQNDTSASAESGGSSEEEQADAGKPEVISGEVRDIPAMDLVAEMVVGWNLGNSLDSTTGGETGWGNIATTQEMIDAVNAKGFNTIRIPVTWQEHMGEAPDYTIDEEWMDRVQEVVNYAIRDDMYVLLDTHHEEGWLIPDAEHQENNKAAIAAIWQQISERFADYGDHLVFEGLNEPRTVGSQNEWNGGTAPERECVKELNKVFYDTVRATGGKNEKRLLLMTSYAGSVVDAAVEDVFMPENDEHFAMSLHAYTPYGFTYQPEKWAYTEWDGSHDNEIINMVYDLKDRFINNGVPVILSEFGAFNAWNEDDVAAWAEVYTGTARQVGIPCIVWDNGSFMTGETFALFNRADCSWYREKYADALVKGATSGE